MNRVECEVSTCLYHNDHLCSLDKIIVEGPSANHKEETCCMSFVEQGAAGENAVGVPFDAVSETGIHCEARNCSYNEKCRCTADEIEVANYHPNASAKSDTLCATFTAD